MGTGLKALGEKQVNFSVSGSADGVAGTQADPAVTALANGDFVVVYENPQAGDSLLAHFFDPNGNAISPPVSSGLLNGVVDIDPAAHVSVDPAVAATPDGGFLVAYTDASVTYNDIPANKVVEVNSIDVRRYDNTTGLSAPFVIDTGAGIHLPNPGPVDHADIAAFADGTSIVVWDFDYANEPGELDVYFGFLNSTANSLVGGPRPLDVHNGFQGEARVATSGNVAAIAHTYDQGAFFGQDIILTLVNSSGTAPAAPIHIFGDNSLEAFSDPDVAALSDGRFVVVARDDTTSALVASIYDLATHAATPVLNLPGVLAAGVKPHVAGVPGGEFVVSFDDSSGDVTEIRFGPGGSALFSAGVANSFTTGTQDQNAIAANSSGTVFATWQDAGSGNPNSTDTDTRIEAQAFHAPPLPQPNFNGDSFADILWRNSTNGDVELWNSNGSGGFTYDNVGAVNSSWRIAGTGDFNGAGEAGLLWRNTNGSIELWNANGSGGFNYQSLNPVNTSWQVAGTGDFTGDGEDGILWRNASTGGVGALEPERLRRLHLRGPERRSAQAGRWPGLEISPAKARTASCGATPRPEGSSSGTRIAPAASHTTIWALSA